MGAPVVIFDPNGVPRHIPIEKAADALAHGGQRGILFNTPDGSQRWIPQNDVHKALQAGGYVADPVDLTINPPGANGQGEGTYKMARPNGDLLHVPYSMVGSAAKLGYVMDQTDRPTYVRDAAADKHLNDGPPMPYGVTIVGRNSAGQPILGSKSMFGLDEPALSRLASSVWEPIAGTASGLYHGLIEGPQNPAEAKMEEEDKIAGPLDVRISRFITEPMKQQAVATKESFNALRSDQLPEHWIKPTPQDVADAYQLRNDLYATAGHALGTVIPGVGPFAVSLGEQLGGKLAVGDYAGAFGTAAGNGILMFAPELREPVGKVLSKGVESLPNAFRGLPRSIVSADDATEDMIRNFGKESQKVADDNKKIEEKNREKTEKVERARNREAASHQEATEKYEKGKTEKKAAFEQEHKDWEDRQQEAIRAHRQAKEETAAANTKALNEHIEAQKADQAAKQSAADELDERKSLEHKLAADQQEFFERAKGARPQAEAVNDALWDAWRDSTKGQTTSTQPVVDAIKEVRESRLLSPTDVAEFNKILKEASPVGDTNKVATLRHDIATGPSYGLKDYDSGTPAQKQAIDTAVRSYGLDPDAADIPADADGTRIHVWKQQLERAERKAEASGNQALAGAFGQVLDKVRAAENDLTEKADQAKAAPGAQATPRATMLLDMARRQHQNLAEAFRDTDVRSEIAGKPRTAENIAIGEHAKPVAESNESTEAVRRLSIHDPEIARLSDEIKATEKRLGELRKPDALQKIIDTPPPVEPPQAKVPEYEEFARKHRVGDEPTEPEYGEPPRSDLDLPEDLQPESLRAPKLKGPKELPSAQEKVVDLLRTLDRRLRTFGKWGAWVLRTTIGAEALRLFFQGHISGFGETMLIGQLGITLLTDILRQENVLKWMARPTEEQMRMLDELPPEDAERLRQALVTLAAVEVKRGAKILSVDPRVAKFMLGTAAGQQPTLQQIQAEAAQRNPKKSRTQSRTPGVTHVYDPDQGKIVSVQ